MNRFLPLLAILVASISIIHAATEAEIGQQRLISELLDQRLNDVYKTVVESATPDEAEKIRDSQRTWLKYRDAEVIAVGKRSRENAHVWKEIQEDDRRFRLKQLTFSRIEDLSQKLPTKKEDWASATYLGEYDAMIDELGVSLDLKDHFDGFKAEAHRGIDGQSGSHHSIFGAAHIVAPKIVAIAGSGSDAAKALMLGRWCILYWEDYRFYLLDKS